MAGCLFIGRSEAAERKDWIMNRMIKKFAGFIGRKTLTKLAAAALGVCVCAGGAGARP